MNKVKKSFHEQSMSKIQHTNKWLKCLTSTKFIYKRSRATK